MTSSDAATVDHERRWSASLELFEGSSSVRRKLDVRCASQMKVDITWQVD
jgi:hypothetical protein